jgi:hypothetical protein
MQRMKHMIRFNDEIPLKKSQSKRLINGLMLVGIILLYSGCGNTHKMSKVDHVVLPSYILPAPRAIPQEVADSLGWGLISEGTFEDDQEEFRMALSSPIPPYHGLRMQKGKELDATYLLFWEKNPSLDIKAPQRNVRWFIQGECEEFYETRNYEYCIPEWFEEPDWSELYEQIDEQGIWTLEPADSLARDSLSFEDRWYIHIEARVSQYFRRYEYMSPDTYTAGRVPNAVLSMVSHMRSLRDATFQRDNFNVYRGYMKGVAGPEFVLCDESETWYFNGNLEDLVVTSAYPVLIENADEQYFYVEARGQVRDEWYTEWFDKVYTRAFDPDEINEIRLISGPKCPY